MSRNEYVLNLADFNDISVANPYTDLRMQAIRQEQAEELAQLMLAAYRGTIDYQDETLDDARHEMQAFFQASDELKPLLAHSRACFEDTILVSAALVGQWKTKQQPLISYFMTHPDWKGRGIGKYVVAEAIHALKLAGYSHVWAVITEGNVISEFIFKALGFQKVQHGTG